MDYEELKEKIEDMCKTHGDKYALFWAAYYLYKMDEEKLREDTKKSLEKFQKDIEEQQKKQEELRFYFEHPELEPKVITPKEYGQKLLRTKKYR